MRELHPRPWTGRYGTHHTPESLRDVAGITYSTLRSPKITVLGPIPTPHKCFRPSAAQLPTRQDSGNEFLSKFAGVGNRGTTQRPASSLTKDTLSSLSALLKKNQDAVNRRLYLGDLLTSWKSGSAFIPFINATLRATERISLETLTTKLEGTPMLWEVLTTFLAICGGTFAFCFYQFSIAPRRHSLWMLCGPPRRSLFHSHMEMILDPPKSCRAHELMAERFGSSVRVQGDGPWDQRLLTLDPVALSHVLRHSNIYEKPWQSRRYISNLIGYGMLSTEGNLHKRQKRVATPAFSVQNLRAFAPIVFDKGFRLTKQWRNIISKSGGSETVMDVCVWLSRATFDVMGAAAFNYEFNSIEDDTNELFCAYKEMFELAVSQNKNPMRQLLGIYFPIINVVFPDLAARTIKKCHKVIYGVAGTLVQEKKKTIFDALQSGKPCKDKDLLALMLKSNLSTDIPHDQRLSDDDILNNINTFMFAGSDTSSLNLTWTLWLLAKNPEVQDRLREELSTIHCPESFEELSMDEIDSLYGNVSELPYLDKVIKEALRLVPPIHSSLRVAVQDDVIPTSQPYKIQKPGGAVTVTSPISVAKGTIIHIPIEAFNLDKSVWGPDSWEFKPDRWDNLPDAVRAQPGQYSNLMTFSAGPRSCIGMRFSVNESKVILYMLVSNFSFHDTEVDIIKSNVVFIRPYVKGRYKEGSQLPLRVVRLDK